MFLEWWHEWMNQSINQSINQSKTLTKYVSCKSHCNFGGRKCNLNQKCDNYKKRCECKNLLEHDSCKKDYMWNPSTCNCKNGRYAVSIIDNSVIHWLHVMKLKKRKLFQEKNFKWNCFNKF